MNFSVKVNLRTASSTSSALGIEKFFANRCLGFSFTVAKAIRTYEKGYEYTNGYENFRSDSYIRKIRIFVYLLNDECEKGWYGEKNCKDNSRVEREFLKASARVEAGTEIVAHGAAQARGGLLQQNADG